MGAMQAHRRRLLACLPAALAPGAALAFRQETALPGLAEEYGESCPAMQAHEELRAELERRLDGRPLPPALAPRISELARCPFCGCAVAGAPDHGEAAPPRG